MKKYKTTGEVAQETGLSARQIKYFIEKGIFIPSEKEVVGKKTVWHYSNNDVKKLSQIKLYLELKYSTEQISDLISKSDFDWKQTLDEQINELRKEKRHLENLLIIAESMRLFNIIEKEYCEFDMSDFDNDVDTFSISLFSTENEENTELGIQVFCDEVNKRFEVENFEKIGIALLEFIKDFKKVSNLDPKSKEVQTFVNKNTRLALSLIDDNEIDLNFLLYLLRLIPGLGVDRLIDILFNKTETLEFLEQALIQNIKDKEGDEVNG